MSCFIFDISRPKLICCFWAEIFDFDDPISLKVISMNFLELLEGMLSIETAWVTMLLFPLDTWLVRMWWCSRTSLHIASSSVTSQYRESPQMRSSFSRTICLTWEATFYKGTTQFFLSVDDFMNKPVSWKIYHRTVKFAEVVRRWHPSWSGWGWLWWRRERWSSNRGKHQCSLMVTTLRTLTPGYGWYNGTMVQWYNGTMVYNGTILTVNLTRIIPDGTEGEGESLLTGQSTMDCQLIFRAVLVSVNWIGGNSTGVSWNTGRLFSVPPSS